MKQHQGTGSVLGTEVKAEWVGRGGPQGKLERTEAKDTLVWSRLCLQAFLSRNQCASTGHQNSSWTSRGWVPGAGGVWGLLPAAAPLGSIQGFLLQVPSLRPLLHSLRDRILLRCHHVHLDISELIPYNLEWAPLGKWARSETCVFCSLLDGSPWTHRHRTWTEPTCLAEGWDFRRTPATTARQRPWDFQAGAGGNLTTPDLRTPKHGCFLSLCSKLSMEKTATDCHPLTQEVEPLRVPCSAALWELIKGPDVSAEKPQFLPGKTVF